jgi:methionyl aminopeptidase
VITRRSKAEIATMRRAGRLVGEVLALVEENLRPGVSTAALDRLAEEHIRKSGGIPSFKGYPYRGVNDFPGSLCISIDREVVHGIPGNRVIEDGQVVSIDAGAIVDGYHGDAARTFIVGEVSARARELVDATRRGLDAGIAAAKPGNRIWDISAAVEDVALALGLGVVRPYVGHGIGTAMHEEPQVPNYRTAKKGIELVPGICLAIEPMFTLGSADVEVLEDDWTVVTRDGSLAAHFEDSIAVTELGPEVLTRL